MDENMRTLMAHLEELLRNVHQYVGARYVPRFIDEPWNDTTGYEALDVVNNGIGTSYIAKKPVPPGTPLSNREYWFVYGSTNGAIINLQNQIDAIVATFIYHIVDTTETDITASLQDLADNIPEGDWIVIPNGVYEVSDYVTITRNINILCQGVIKPVGTLNDVTKGVLYFDGVTAADIVVKCENTAYASTCNVVMMKECSNIHVHDSYINIKQNSYDGTAGINLGKNTSKVKIDSSYICAQYGVLANDITGVDDIIIENNTFASQNEHGGIQGDAIEFNTPTYGSSNIRILNNFASGYIYDNNSARILVFGFAHVNDVIIKGNIIFNCDSECIHLENGCSHFIIDSNLLNKVFTGITVISNSATRINQDIIITNNNIDTEGMLGSHNIDGGFAIDITTSNDGNWNARIKIANNDCYGGTDSSNGIGVYNGLDVQVENNLIRKFVRSGLDLCVYGDSIGAGLENIRATDNEISLCGWSARLGYRSYKATAKAIRNFTFKNNLLNGSTYGINIISCVEPTGIHDVQYFAQTGNSNYYSKGDIIITELSGTVAAGTKTHKYCNVPGTPSSATLVDLY